MSNDNLTFQEKASGKGMSNSELGALLGGLLVALIAIFGLSGFVTPIQAQNRVPVELQQWQKGYNEQVTAIEKSNEALSAQLASNFQDRVAFCEYIKLGAQMKITYGQASVNSKEYSDWKTKTMWDCQLKAQQGISNSSNSFPLNLQ